VGLVVAAVVYLMAKDFLALILAADDVSVGEAWRRLLEMMRTDKVAFAGYVGLKFLLSIATSIVLFASALVLFIPLFVVAVAANAGLMGIGSDVGNLAFVGTLALGGLMLIIMLTALSVPLVVFFPASGLYFLASRYAPLEAWLAAHAQEAGSTG
jgi:hypothetical protein